MNMADNNCSMSRRCFIGCIGLGSLSTALLSDMFGNYKSGDENMGKGESGDIQYQNVKIKPEELVGYCGNYCGKCGICGLNIQTNLAVLNNIMQVAAFRDEAEHLGWPLMRDIASQCCIDFEKDLESFNRLVSKIFPKKGCRDNCVPPCEIARCCKEKGYFTCAECSSIDTCDHLQKPKMQEMVKNLNEIKKVGVKQWVQKQHEAAINEKRKALLDAVNKAFT
ncbi:DUF3795 domain-containing protein [Candidatus Poribacteria bacterium]|nr:DUF3795 domain-containing protein [Candidatus Poribacteria bacterium]